MDLRATWILYRRELRSALRERTIVVNGILMPIFLYPVLLWVMFSALTFVQGLSDTATSRVAFVSTPPAQHLAVLDSIAARDGIVVIRQTEGWGLGGPTGSTESGFPLVTERRALAGLQEGELDAVVGFERLSDSASSLPDNMEVTVRYDRAESRSVQALTRIEQAVGGYRSLWVEHEVEDLGMSPEESTPFVIESENVASGENLGKMLLGQMLSLFIVIMVALGCFVPSVDTTAGERERSTWETIMTVAAPRSSIITAKYLSVATLGVVAGILNVLALFLSMGAVIRPLMEDAGDITFRLPLASIPVMIAGAAVLALFFAAAMMILASFARTFKDGQAMIQPVYWLVFLPVLLGDQSGQTLTPTVAAIPVANISMMIRDAINGVYIWPLIIEALLVTLATVAVCLVVARYLLRFEDFLLGSFDGSLWRFLRSRLSTSRAS
ncbi:MAG TPA: ABC transporter permease subunit [Longimicrobiales bacterium]|nr:ABC transporter permease subunit [Longimicrobiales bacterium]